tara:strand:- start:201 stop:572 length:372 start_codon:yes stop_codon:yes gene_type:complete
MGADQYMNAGKGKTAQVAFDKVTENARWNHGHGGYSGTIAEKYSMVEFPRPKGTRRATVIQAVRDLGSIGFDADGNPKTDKVQAKYPKLSIAKMFDVYDSKSGPSLAIELKTGEYLFAGWASA